MLFNSLQFVFLFFPVVTAAYFLLPHRWRKFLLLIASSYFYASFVPKYLLILFFLIAVDYAAGILIEDASTDRRRKKILLASLAANVGALAVFKYFNFFNSNLAELAGLIGWNYPVRNLELILPIGLSFHTFQSMGYTIEVFFRRQRAERNFWFYALYVMYYPQLVAGPIERPGNLLAQFREHQRFDLDRFVSGMKLVLFGFFKKVVIADRLSIFVDNVYSAPTAATGLSMLLATYFFSFQIYCDFSGYTDIARGVSRIMGIELMVNFNYPYVSKSIGEFWKRWHISLSSWFRDYVYIPLGGNRVSHPVWIRNTLIVFLASGLWHGANWTFVIWGALHGIYLVAGRITAPARNLIVRATGINRLPRLHSALQVLATFHLVTFGWIFFRADSVSGALYVIGNMFRGWRFSMDYVGYSLFPFQQDLTAFSLFATTLALLAVLELSQVFLRRSARAASAGHTPVNAHHHGLAWGCVVMLILLFGVYGSKTFIYFQF